MQLPEHTQQAHHAPRWAAHADPVSADFDDDDRKQDTTAVAVQPRVEEVSEEEFERLKREARAARTAREAARERVADALQAFVEGDSRHLTLAQAAAELRVSPHWLRGRSAHCTSCPPYPLWPRLLPTVLIAGRVSTAREWFDRFKTWSDLAQQERAYWAGLSDDQRQHYRCARDLEQRIELLLVREQRQAKQLRERIAHLHVQVQEQIAPLQVQVQVHATACGYVPLHRCAPARQGNRE